MQKNYAGVYKILCNVTSVSFRPINTGTFFSVIIVAVIIIISRSSSSSSISWP